jgi:hypothetical protein
MQNYTIEFDLGNFLKKNDIGLKEVLEVSSEDNCLYDMINAATDLDNFADGAIGAIIDIIEDNYDFKSFVNELSDKQKEELKTLLL